MRKIGKFLMGMCIAVLLIACEHKELCYDHSHTVNLQVVFDWINAPDAKPESMSLYLFPADGGEALRYEFTDYTGGCIRVPVGNYEALCLNSDTENVGYRNTERRSSFEVTTQTTDLMSGLSALGVRSAGVPRADGTETERVALSPDMLWCDCAEGIELKLADQQKLVTLYPKQSVCNYTIEIRNVENLKYVSGICGSLSSLSGGLFAGRSCTTDECVTIPFETTICNDKTTVMGALCTFGHCPSIQTVHMLTIYAVLADGSKWYYTYDADEVTAQIHTASDSYNVHIVLDGLSFPKPLVNGGGFQPEVNEWENIDVTIEM